MRTIEYIKYGIRDPLASLTYLTSSYEGLSYLFLKRLLNLSKKQYTKFKKDLFEHEELLKSIDQELKSLGKPIGQISYIGVEALYIITRAIKPKVIVETGVAAGMSSAFILMGLEDNGFGELHSIDMPNYDLELYNMGMIQMPSTAILPKDKKPGFIVPDELKQKWHLHIGLSKEILPTLLEELFSIDAFLHDSEHTYENMMFEYKTSWPFIKNGGILLSHDISLNSSFFDFSKSFNINPCYLYFTSIGGIRKVK